MSIRDEESLLSDGKNIQNSKLFNILIYLSVFIAGAAFILKFQSVVFRVLSPVQVQQEEAVNVEFGRILASGRALYPDIREGGPYIHCSYPPLFPFLESRFLKLTSNPWLPGRLLALTGYWGCGFLMVLAGWKRWKLNFWIVLLPLFLWLSPTWASWGSMARLDTLLLFFNLSAFFTLLRNTEHEGEKVNACFWIVPGFLNAAAILMKPTALTLTLSLSLWAIRKRQWKGLSFFLLGALGPVLVFFAVFQRQTNGMYWLHTIRWAAVGFSVERFLYFFLHGFLKETGWLVALVFITLAFKKTPLILRLQLLFSFLSLWTLCRDGSAENYYMEFILYGLLLAGEGWAKKDGGTPETAGNFWASNISGILVLTGAVSFFMFPGPPMPSNDEIKMKESVLSIYRQGEIHLALDNDLPLMAGKPVWYQASGIISIAQSGEWNPAPLLRDIQNHKFTTIEFYDIPHQYLYPPGVEQAVMKNYRIQWKAYGRVWYVPKM